MKILFALLGLTLAAQTAHQVTISWTDPNNPTGTQYNVYKLTGACPATAPVTVAAALTAGFVKLNSAPISGLTTVDTVVTVGTSYCYLVTATIPPVESNASPDAGATVLPFAPGNMTITVK